MYIMMPQEIKDGLCKCEGPKIRASQFIILFSKAIKK